MGGTAEVTASKRCTWQQSRARWRSGRKERNVVPALEWEALGGQEEGGG